ncbi:unnamed protein product [Lactuca virosa]|uniref:Uncharacterized protein n=1 Tax=Lactuca virosa TaxID=75947 RepID=A0AAU9M1Z9_9ASTR|nr:unnamed protein product [Lactuca virosa]
MAPSLTSPVAIPSSFPSAALLPPLSANAIDASARYGRRCHHPLVSASSKSRISPSPIILLQQRRRNCGILPSSSHSETGLQFDFPSPNHIR